MPGQDDDRMQPLLGQRLHAIRMDRGLSLAAVSRETNISRSFLSLVENGQNEITIGRLVRLIGFYGVHVNDFFADLALAGEPRHVVRRAERRPVLSPDERLDVHLLVPDDERSMLPMTVELEPGGALAEMDRHPGEEFVHVIEGEVELRLEGEAPAVLLSGDTAWYSGEQGHSLANRSRRPTRVIVVTNPGSPPPGRTTTSFRGR